MSCQFKKECPSYSGWCEGPKQDFANCVTFLIPAYKRLQSENAALKLQQPIHLDGDAARSFALALELSRLKQENAKLRAKPEQPDNKPLTLDELREMGGEPVWSNTRECYGLVDDREPCNMLFVMTDSRDRISVLDDYYRRPHSANGEKG